MKRCLLVGWLLVLGLLGADWPQWRGPDRTGKSKETGLQTQWPEGGPSKVWTFDKAGVGYSSPAVVGDRIYLLGSDDPEKGDKEFALCLNVEDGSEVWRVPLETQVTQYATQWGSGPRSTPTVDGDYLYVLAACGDLRCLNTKDGKQVWGLNLIKDLGGKLPVWGYSESPLIDGTVLLVTPGGDKGTLAALDKKTGQVIWRSKNTDAAAYSSIIFATVGKVKQYIQMVPEGVVGTRASDGVTLWRSEAGKNRTAVIPTPIFDGNMVFVTSGYNSGCGLIQLREDGDGTKSRNVYMNKAIVNHHGGVILHNDHMFGFSDKTASWVCLDYKQLDNENEAAKWSSKALDKGSITFADNHFYCYGQEKGTCVLIEASTEGWKEKGRFEIPEKSRFPRKSGKIWTHPVVANGKLYLRDHEYLFCFDVSATKK